MNTSENLDRLSDVLLNDPNIVSALEMDFLTEFLHRANNHSNGPGNDVTRTITRIAGEIVAQRACGLVGDTIVRRLAERPITFGTATSFLGSRMSMLPPRPPSPTPPAPGPGPGYNMELQSQVSATAVLERPEILPPRCVVLEEFLAPPELDELLAYALSHENQFQTSEVISPGPRGSTVDFEYRRSRVLLEVGSQYDKLVNRLRATLPRALSRLELEPFTISNIEVQITASNDADFFRWHSDNAQQEVATRRITFVYFFHREPKMFQGGELRLYDSRWESGANMPTGNYFTVVPRQNQVVLFDSSLAHEITYVDCPSRQFVDSRFTVNGWIRS